MKKLFYVALAVMLSVVSCQEFDDSAIWDKLDNHESRIMNLEELCKQMNTNIASLQTLVTALQNNDYVTAVVPVTKDNETVGYTISFTKSQPITIYHGVDGKDGANGKDGENGKDGQDGQDGKDGNDGITPIVGVKKDVDGVYYWTMNGEWLLDASGKKIKAQGTDGKDGVYGKDGQNGKTPEFKIENGDWYVSYDEGVSWDIIGQATGADGINPQFKMENGLWHVSYDNGMTWNKLGKAEGIDGITPEFKIENGFWYVSYDEGISWDILGHATGADGVTPQIKIENGYWQITYDNGKSWSKLGKAEGVDGITPLLKIEDEYWYISYDNGEYWEMLGKATGEDGKDGINGKNGDSFFQYVDTSNSDYVEFILTDGTHITLPTWYAFVQQRTLCNQMNKNITSLQEIVSALKKNDYLISCNPLMENGVELGYILQFDKYGSIVIYHGKDGSDGKDGVNGKNGIAPVISAKENSEGVLCWTLDGEWMYDEYGNSIPVHGRDGVDGKDAVSPQLKIEDGYWYVSYNNGKTWSKLNKATGEDGQDAINYFQDVTQDEDYVYLTLISGEVVEVPKHHVLSVTFDETEDIRVLVNKTYSIGYRIIGADDKTVIKALAQDGFRAVVKKTDNATGVIEITTPSTILPTEVLVFVTDGKERTIMRSINFVEGVIVVSSKSFSVDYAGGTVTVPLSTNIDYTVEIPETDKSWITLVQTRAVMRNETLTFNVAQNEQQAVRYTTVRLVDALGVVSETILITQKAGIAKSVHVETAGTLEDLIDGNNTALIEEFTVTGKVNIMDLEYIVSNCPNLKLLDLSLLTNTTLPPSCFANSKISNIILPLNLSHIPERAFYKSSIQHIYIPESVQSIGDYAFSECKYITGDVIIPNNTKSIGEYCFANSTFNGILNLGGIVNIGQYAFGQCKGLTGDLQIPDSVVEIGIGAFYQCEGFEGKLTIGNSIVNIPEKAFYKCIGFSKLSIGASVTNIGTGAFAYCKALTGNLIIPDKVETINRGAFYGCEGFNGYLYIGKSVKKIGQLAFLRFSWIKKLTGYNHIHNEKIGFSKVYCEAVQPPTIYYGNTTYEDGNQTITQDTFEPVFKHQSIYALEKASTFIETDDSGYGVNTKIDCLIIPSGSKSLYEADKNWVKQFALIEETDF